MEVTPGVKDDGLTSNGKPVKPRWDLMPWGPLERVVNVLTFGARKYAPGNWMHVPEARERYFAAAQRHFVAWFGGQTIDPDSGEHHLACGICCLLFLIWHDENQAEKRIDLFDMGTPETAAPDAVRVPDFDGFRAQREYREMDATLTATVTRCSELLEETRSQRKTIEDQMEQIAKLRKLAGLA